MKLLEFKKLIREEVRKVLQEQQSVLKNITASTIGYDFPVSKFKKLFGSFAIIKKGPTKSEYTMDYVIDLDVDALVNLLKSNKNYSILDADYAIDVYYKGNDSLDINSDKLPKDIINKLVAVGTKEEDDLNLVNIQIGTETDGFELPDEYSLPKAVELAVGEFSSQADPDDDDAYSNDIDRYLAKIEKALLIAGKKVVPGLKKYTMEDGYIVFELPRKATPEIQSKLKALYKGARSIEF